jgi:DME family drug/metabolite transporter
LILLIEPVLDPVWSWIFHGERPTPWAVLGGVVILGATTLKALIDARSPAAVAEA